MLFKQSNLFLVNLHNKRMLHFILIHHSINIIIHYLNCRIHKLVLLLFLYSLSCSPFLHPFIGFTSLHSKILFVLNSILSSHRELLPFNHTSFQYEGIHSSHHPLIVINRYSISYSAGIRIQFAIYVNHSSAAYAPCLSQCF